MLRLHLKLRSPSWLSQACWPSVPYSSSAKTVSLAEYTPKVIRNFCIIAHVDHGKSTLADRLLEHTGAISRSTSNVQVLDKLSVERARGITVKSQTAALFCPFESATYLLNLVDTPGHTDFSYEVKRSIMASDNAILLVDACEGVMAQTLATYHLASSRGLKIIPVLNKIDLAAAKLENAKEQLKTILDIQPCDVLSVSAKEGVNIEDILMTLILDGKSPSPPGSRDTDAHFVVIDSEHQSFRGTIVTVLVRGGVLSVGTELRALRNDRVYKIRGVGIFSPTERVCDALYPGQIGFVTMGIRSPVEVVTGDVFYAGLEKPADVDSMGPPKPLVYAGLFPADQQGDQRLLKDALDKLRLNDPSVDCALENHPALGAGWRLGFMGLLHMDVFRQRLEEEYDANVILTSPSVSYRVRLKGIKNIKKYGGDLVIVNNTFMPDDAIAGYEEMHINGSIIVPETYLSGVLKLCMSHRGRLLTQNCIDDTRLLLTVDFPLSEVILNFHDQLKTISSGFASFEFVETGWQPAELTKLTVQLNGKEVDELTQLVPKTAFIARAWHLADALAGEIPRQQFLIRIQVFAKNRSVASCDIKPYRKDVTAKLHAADPSRRNKLLQRQNEGKKRLRMVGAISMPRDVFINVLKKTR